MLSWPSPVAVANTVVGAPGAVKAGGEMEPVLPAKLVGELMPVVKLRLSDNTPSAGKAP